MKSQALDADILYRHYEVKGMFTPRTITIKINILVSTPAEDIVLFIERACLSVTLNAQAPCCKMDSDWLSMVLSLDKSDSN